MGVKGLAEGIILQSLEDLWSENDRGECIAFFTGRDFSICAEIAGMNQHNDTVGEAAVDFIRQFKVDYAVIGVSAMAASSPSAAYMIGTTGLPKKPNRVRAPNPGLKSVAGHGPCPWKKRRCGRPSNVRRSIWKLGAVSP